MTSASSLLCILSGRTDHNNSSSAPPQSLTHPESSHLFNFSPRSLRSERQPGDDDDDEDGDEDQDKAVVSDCMMTPRTWRVSLAHTYSVLSSAWCVCNRHHHHPRFLPLFHLPLKNLRNFHNIFGPSCWLAGCGVSQSSNEERKRGRGDEEQLVGKNIKIWNEREGDTRYKKIVVDAVATLFLLSSSSSWHRPGFLFLLLPA